MSNGAVVQFNARVGRVATLLVVPPPWTGRVGRSCEYLVEECYMGVLLEGLMSSREWVEDFSL